MQPGPAATRACVDLVSHKRQQRDAEVKVRPHSVLCNPAIYSTKSCAVYNTPTLKKLGRHTVLTYGTYALHEHCRSVRNVWRIFLASLARDNANVNLVEKRKFKTDATAPYESCVIASVVHGFIVLLVIKKYAGLRDRLDHSLKWLLLRSAMLERNLGKGGVVCLSVRPSVCHTLAPSKDKSQDDVVFAARCYASTALAVMRCLCVCVCPSVCHVRGFCQNE